MNDDARRETFGFIAASRLKLSLTHVGLVATIPYLGDVDFTIFGHMRISAHSLV
jgi:hypothetical protein